MIHSGIGIITGIIHIITDIIIIITGLGVIITGEVITMDIIMATMIVIIIHLHITRIIIQGEAIMLIMEKEGQLEQILQIQEEEITRLIKQLL